MKFLAILVLFALVGKIAPTPRLSPRVVYRADEESGESDEADDVEADDEPQGEDGSSEENSNPYFELSQDIQESDGWQQPNQGQGNFQGQNSQVQGYQAVQGVQGYQDIQGVQSYQDIQGVQGYQGIQGVQEQDDVQGGRPGLFQSQMSKVFRRFRDDESDEEGDEEDEEDFNDDVVHSDVQYTPPSSMTAGFGGQRQEGSFRSGHVRPYSMVRRPVTSSSMVSYPMSSSSKNRMKMPMYAMMQMSNGGYNRMSFPFQAYRPYPQVASGYPVRRVTPTMVYHPSQRPMYAMNRPMMYKNKQQSPVRQSSPYHRNSRPVMTKPLQYYYSTPMTGINRRNRRTNQFW